MDRVILHCDCNSFYASVETVLDPGLKNVPMAVCGDPQSRHGIILAKNELAKRFGVQTAETIYAAKKKCPGLVLVAPHRKMYSEFSKKANDIYKEYTDMVEPFGIDESWLDVTGSRLLFGSGKKIADELRQRFKAELGITCSVGVAFNKSMAKLASDYKKPDATTVITRENFKSLVYPLPISSLLYAGRHTTETLKKLYISTIGDLASANRGTIVKHLGKTGGLLFDYACGIDEEPVESIYREYEQKSIGCSLTFKQDLHSQEDIKYGVMTVARELTGRMRRVHVKCTTLCTGIKYHDFTFASKQMPLEFATNLFSEITAAALLLIRQLNKDSKPVRMISITGSHLTTDTADHTQLSFFETNETRHKKQQRLEDAIEKIRHKYGVSSVEIGGLLDKDM